MVTRNGCDKLLMKELGGSDSCVTSVYVNLPDTAFKHSSFNRGGFGFVDTVPFACTTGFSVML